MALFRAEKVAKFATYSRLLVLLMQTFFNLLMPDHDAKVFTPPVPYTRNSLDNLIELFLEGFHRWDSIYFIHIAEHGYTYENTLAFFPLYPLTTYLLANTFLYPLQHICNYFSVLLLAGYLVNLWCFVQAAKVLYSLSHKVLKDETLAFKAVQVFCINPASIFFSAYYSEAMFALLVFRGMLSFEDTDMLKSGIWFGLSTLCRSNGLVNLGYPLYYYGKELVFQLTVVKGTQLVDIKSKLIGFLATVYLYSVPVMTSVLLVGAPFLLYQYYTSIVFCNPNADYRNLQSHIVRYGVEKGYKMAHTGVAKWCNGLFPTSYSYVQATHWNQGFMNYYQLKQLPNFLLAAPMIILSVSAIISYVRKNQRYCATLGLLPSSKRTDDKDIPFHSFHSKKIFVYIVHLGFLLLCAVFFMHVQVITRFICSSSPVIYWFIAYLTTPDDQLSPTQNSNQFDVFAKFKQTDSSPPQTASSSHIQPKPISRTSSERSNSEDMIDWENQNWKNKLIFIYIHLYFFVGIGAFSNFLPWT